MNTFGKNNIALQRFFIVTLFVFQGGMSCVYAEGNISDFLSDTLTPGQFIPVEDAQFQQRTQFKSQSQVISGQGDYAAQPGDIIVRHGKGILGPPFFSAMNKITGDLIPLDDIPHMGLLLENGKTFDLQVEKIAGENRSIIYKTDWDDARRFKNPGFFSVLESNIPIKYKGDLTTFKNLPSKIKTEIRGKVCEVAEGYINKDFGKYKATSHCGDATIRVYDEALASLGIIPLRYEGVFAFTKVLPGMKQRGLVEGKLRDWFVNDWFTAGSIMDPSETNDKLPRVGEPPSSTSLGGVSMRIEVSDDSFEQKENNYLDTLSEKKLKSKHHGDLSVSFLQTEQVERTCLSLRVLFEKVSDSISSGDSIPHDCLNLAGINYIEGYMIDRGVPKDIILFGSRIQGRPGLRLDDLLVNMRCIAKGVDYPYCSLEPRQEDTRALQRLFGISADLESSADMKLFFEKVQETVGPQMVIVGGVPRNSRHAHVMIDADYHMKKVSQGSVVIDGVTSYLDLPMNEAANKIKNGEPVPASGVSMARFWFHIGEGSPKFQEGTDIAVIDECSMVILTEKQKTTASGELIDVVEDDPHAVAFADEMSEYLSIPGSSIVPIYAELENLFRLRALLLSMKYQKAFKSIGWSFSSFMPEYEYRDERPMDLSMPGLANYKEWSHEVSSGSMRYTYTLFPIICGGVGMDMVVDKNSYREDLASKLFSFRMAVLMARKSKDTLSWKL